MSSRALAATFALLLAAPANSLAQGHGQPPAWALTPSAGAAALLPGSSNIPSLAKRQFESPPAPPLDGDASSSFLVTATVLAGASLGGLWAGRQIPLPAADDDSDLSVGHLITAPVASIATVAVASVLLGNQTSTSLVGALLGAAAGVGTGLAASMVMSDTGIVLTYVGVHGLVSALTTR